MKRIINTTDEKIEVDILGNHYILEASSFLDVPVSVAEYWRGNLHTFLKESEVPENKIVKEIPIVEETLVEKIKKTTRK